ncbi:glycosyltransferase family 9 protein [Winogradskyella sp. 3972H.M.0a.05]|uniref:glycosyltransferase family 9 protein n=1 Tax=Winogradskyella sp. 3972H.M.0a.05 TaxID=2950277 RepID=UPI003394F507
MKVLIIQQKMIGDVLTSSILFEAIKSKYNNAELHYVINSHTYPVVENNPFIDQFLFVSPDIEKSKSKFYSFLKHIKKEKYDVVIDVYSKTSSNLMTFFSKAKKRISKHKSYTAFLYTNTFREAKQPKTNAGLAVENRLQLLEPLGLSNDTIIKPKIYLTDSEKNNAKAFLTTNGINLSKPLYMISVLGSGASKTYPFEYMASVLKTTVDTKPDSQILFNYIPKQAEDARAIYELCDKHVQDHIFFDVFGKNLRDFLAITSHCDALIGNEGGAVNMAKALNIPTFTIFSPWIIKEAWNMFDDGSNHISVHLNDFKPEHYNSVSHLKELKKNSEALYKEFNPELFEDKLSAFLS